MCTSPRRATTCRGSTRCSIRSASCPPRSSLACGGWTGSTGTRRRVPGIEANSGSLGMGISKGPRHRVGEAAARLGRPCRRHGRGRRAPGGSELRGASGRGSTIACPGSPSSSTATSSSPTSRRRRSSRSATSRRSSGVRWHVRLVRRPRLRGAAAARLARWPPSATGLRCSSPGRSRAGRLVHGASCCASRRRRHVPLARRRARRRELRAGARRAACQARAGGARAGAAARGRAARTDARGRAGERGGDAHDARTEYVVEAYGDALVELAGATLRSSVLDADLASDCRVRGFEEAYPERFVECGIAEQDMVSVAGGSPATVRARRQLVR